MFPEVARNDLFDRRDADPLESSYLTSGHSSFGVQPSYLDHVCFGNSSTWMGFANPTEPTFALPQDVSSFARHVPHVVTVGTQEQMGGLRTRRVVAFVQDVQLVGNRAEMDYPRDTVSFIDSGLAMSADSDYAIAVAISGRGPFPTIVVNNYLSPEPLGQGLHAASYDSNTTEPTW